MKVPNTKADKRSVIRGWISPGYSYDYEKGIRWRYAFRILQRCYECGELAEDCQCPEPRLYKDYETRDVPMTEEKI